MLKKLFSKYPYLILTVGFLLSVVSCEKDFKNIGVDLVDNNVFSLNNYDAQIKAYNKNITHNTSNNLDNYLLGTQEDPNFGSLTASVVGQLSMPTSSNPDFGENAEIDSVVFVIPYPATLVGSLEVDDPTNPGETISVNEYELDSIFSIDTGDFVLNIYELGTYLNALDPIDPFVSNEFYSDDSFQKIGSPLYSGLVKPSALDTMMLIDRFQYEDATLTNRVVYDQDTVKLTNSAPFLSIPIDKPMIKQIFQDNASTSSFASNDNFKHYFRGLYLEVTDSGTGKALMYLDLSGAYMSIYYTQTEIRDEGAEEDLDGDGVLGETNVVIPTSSNFNYSFSGIKVNLYDRDYAGSLAQSYLASPNMTAGDDKLFVHGAAGADGIIHLFGDDANANDIPDELETLRNNNWLINDAQLYLYIDKDHPYDYYPERIFLYEIEGGENYQAYETTKQGLDRVAGFLVYDADDEPDYYLFHLTDYVSEILKADTEVEITDFGVKSYDPNDVWLGTSDTLMRKYNNNFKGAVIHGNTAAAGERKLKFQIFYTEINN